MNKNPFAPDFKDLPETLPIFPLAGVLLLPGGQLPLNIFEPRYLAMISDAMASGRMIGMVQPDARKRREEAPFAVYQTGCAGKIVEFAETTDGRFLISLHGICRFHVTEELDMHRGYRRVRAGWDVFSSDLATASCLDLDRDKLKTLLRQYFDAQGMGCDWQAVENAPDNKLITCLAMACPFSAEEKQALLETPCCKERAVKFMALLEIAVHGPAGAQH